MPPAPSLQEVVRLVEEETGQSGPLGRLRAAAGLVRDLADVGDAALGYFVDQARHAGHSWSEIGEALGVSKQAAQQRHVVRSSPGSDAPTFERLTPRAHNVVNAAEEVAREWGHAAVDTEHLLLSLYEEPDGVAARVLLDEGFPLSKAVSDVGRRVKRGRRAPRGPLPFGPRAKDAVDGALASALELGHSYVGTEHILLGLGRGEGVAGEVLIQAGLTPDVLRQRVEEIIDRYAQAGRSLRARAKGTTGRATPAKDAARPARSRSASNARLPKGRSR